jgi:cardiolipin synthase
MKPATFSPSLRWADLLAFLQPRWLGGHTLQLLAGGDVYFPALCSALAAAQHSIYLETYIFARDDTARQIKDALCAAARRGVRVRLVTDGFGTPHLPKDWGVEFEQAGVAWRVFRPESRPWRLSRQRLRRLHRKLVLIDDALAFIGGINIVDDWRHDDGQILAAPRADFAVQISGPIVQQIRVLAIRQWWQLDWFQMQTGLRPHWRRDFPAYWREWWGAHRADNRVPDTVFTYSAAIEQAEAALALRDNLRHRYTIENAYLEALAEAKQEVILANAYFFPGREFRHALCDAARRGVAVTLILQGQSEHPIQYYGSQVLYRELLAAGIQIYEYQPSYLHAKVAVIDPQLSTTWATVGSSNIDPYSLMLAREANVLVRNPAFSAVLVSALSELRAHSRAIALSDLAQLPWWRRLLSWLGYGLLRLGIWVIGRYRHY